MATQLIVTHGSTVRRWAKRRLGAIDHELRVMRLAVGIFDLLQKHHDLPARYRTLLKQAALLHDIGRCCRTGKHHIHGEKIIRRSSSLWLDNETRLFAAYAARHHRGQIPRENDDARRLRNADNRSALRILLAMIRTADALDKRGLHRPTLVLKLSGDVLNITILPHAQPRKVRRELWTRRKFRMLREELGVRVHLRMDKGALARTNDANELWI